MPAPDFTSRGATRRLAALAASQRSLASSSALEPEILGLSSVVGNGAVCLDIGAAYGMYSFPLAELVGPTGQVHAVEPQPTPHRVLSGLRRLCGVPQLQTYRFGMAAKSGTREMTLPVRFGLPVRGHAHMRSDREQDRLSRTRTWRAETRSVDEFRAQRPLGEIDFIKIDAEGFEPDVLAGARQTLTADRPALLLEIEDRHLRRYGTNSRELQGFLREFGYTMYTWQSRSTRGLRSRSRWITTDVVTAKTRNYLFATDEAWQRQSSPLACPHHRSS